MEDGLLGADVVGRLDPGNDGVEMSAQREELSTLILDEFRPPQYGGSWRLNPGAAADAILAAGYGKHRTISTIEELDALQSVESIVSFWESGKRAEASVIRDAEGRVYERDVDNAHDELEEGRHAGWWETGNDNDEITSETVLYPVTVLYASDEL